MSDDVVRRYNGARPIQAPAQLLADAIREVEVLRKENARLREALKPFVPETQWIDPDIPDARPIDVMVRAGELRAAKAAILGKVKAEAACPAPDEAL